MKLPEHAPSFADVIGELSSPAVLTEVLGTIEGPTVSGKYLHYSELLRRQPPGDITHRQWWLGLLLSRRAGFSSLPLEVHPAGSRVFHYGLPDPIPQGLHRIDMLAGGRVGMDQPITNPDTRDQYYVSSLIEEAIHSSQLEGATTTRQVAKKMLREGREPRTVSERMIVNNYQTMRRIGELRGLELTPDLVFELHRLVTDETLSDANGAGRFRTANEEVAVWHDDDLLWSPPPADQLERRLQEMCAFANGTNEDGFVHPVVRAILLHFWLAYDHPFVDGNGRTARALFYWAMLHAGYWLFEFISISRTILRSHGQYRDAFLYAEDTDDATYFLLYHVKVILDALDELHAYIERRQRELSRLESELQQLKQLNHRQRALIRHALRNPLATYTAESHRNSHNVVYETARRDLVDLESRGLLVKDAVGKRLVYSPVRGLEEKLRARGG